MSEQRRIQPSKKSTYAEIRLDRGLAGTLNVKTYQVVVHSYTQFIRVCAPVSALHLILRRQACSLARIYTVEQDFWGRRHRREDKPSRPRSRSGHWHAKVYADNAEQARRVASSQALMLARRLRPGRSAALHWRSARRNIQTNHRSQTLRLSPKSGVDDSPHSLYP
ncbi:hypothetical protein BD311DRAFT_477701 [Dichomitus squalens]|uniref:Uncharacterized protein n=1 Tax=Dichomitus squalens TaxID=114155 RepID=A0A4Q9N1T2_9APHY|nr:hypothetical protein BD311DRAFT_477701 [Dichomitus squalens]